MSFMLSDFFVVLCILNVIFWGFFPHNQHCQVAAKMGISKCAPHWVHVYVMAPVFLLLGMYTRQGSAGLF